MKWIDKLQEMKIVFIYQYFQFGSRDIFTPYLKPS